MHNSIKSNNHIGKEPKKIHARAQRKNLQKRERHDSSVKEEIPYVPRLEDSVQEDIIDCSATQNSILF